MELVGFQLWRGTDFRDEQRRGYPEVCRASTSFNHSDLIAASAPAGTVEWNFSCYLNNMGYAYVQMTQRPSYTNHV